MRATTGFIPLTFAVASLLLMPAANAQTQAPASPPTTTPGAKTPSADIPDKKLDAVAAAVKNVSSVSDTYKKKLAQAPDAQKEKIIDEANVAVSKAVTDQGLSVEEYMSIMKVAENDSTVRDKLIQRLK